MHYPRSKTFFIKTYGCQANEADSGKLSELLEELGFSLVNEVENASLFIIDSCAVRQKSEDKIYGLGKGMKSLEPKPYVVLSGCVVGSTKGERSRTSFSELKNKTPWVDLYLTPQELMSLPMHLSKAGFEIADNYSENQNIPVSDDGYVNISYGCDNFCSYCVVPYSRGKEISRSLEDILKEINLLVQKGIKNITLCGQNVNSWGLDALQKKQVRIGEEHKLPFSDLLREVHKILKVESISFMSSNPFDFTADLIETLRLPKINNYLHIAVQSGNNQVLQRMNRRHTVEEFINLIDAIKEVRPDMTFGTDIIVGFPGETRDQFRDTVDLFNKVKFNVAYISIYSSRPGTLAAEQYEDNVSLKEKKYRHAFLTKAWKESLK